MEKVETGQPIETKELRGISVKTVATIITCTVSIVIAIIGSYSKLQAQISDVQKSNDVFKQQYAGDTRYNDLQYKTLELRIQTLEINIKDIQSKIK